MQCNLCNEDFISFKDFKIHILKKHQNSDKETHESEESENENSSDIDGENVNIDDENSEMDDENFEIYDENSVDSEAYEEDHKTPNDDAEASEMDYKHDDASEIDYNDAFEIGDDDVASEIGNDDASETDDDENASEIGEDENASEDNVEASEVHDDDSSNLCTSSRKHYDLTEKSRKKEDKLSVSNTSQRKNKVHNTKRINGNIIVSDKLVKKYKALSNLKKPVCKVNEILSIKNLSKNGQSIGSCIPEQSHSNSADQSENSFNGGNGLTNSRLAVTNSCFNSQSVPTNYVNTQPIFNNTVLLGYPYASQNINNPFIRNEVIQPPIYVANPISTQLGSFYPLQNRKKFDFNSKNILNWLANFRIAYKGIPYPFPSSLFNTVLTVQEACFKYYSTSIKEESMTLMKVYEELDCIVHKHINSVGSKLNT